MNTFTPRWLLCLLLPAAGLVACQKTEPPPAVVVVPGPTGATGATGEAGKPGTDATVIVVTPPASAASN